MPCPYAADLSEDEDGLSASSSPSLAITEKEALLEARRKCPAFAHNAPCPFRGASAADPASLLEVMKTVPPSHFPRRGSDSATGGSDGEENGAAIPFRVAMEHVHRVSSRLSRQNSGGSGDDQGAPDRDDEGRARSDSFIVQGGCPFKSFHKKNANNGNTASHLARAMENFSLAAIMGRIASQGLDLDEEEEEGGHDPKTSATRVSGSTSEQLEGTPSVTHQPSSQERRPSLMLSQALKSGTAESHTAAENVHFVHNFINGVIDRELYMELLTGLYHTYVCLEALLDEHAPTHFPTLHFPEELSRTAALRDDMEYWHGNFEAKPECRTPSPAVRDYIKRMQEVGRLDPLLLLSHAYTRYLGDLSGGKVLLRIARRALNLSKGYDGLQFYNFERIRSAKLFKDQYRRAMDELPLAPDQVGRLVAEANVSFAMNMRVFEELDVKGGVAGATVRDVDKALSYYYVEVEEQKKRTCGDQKRAEGGQEEEEAKCPFGFKGPNPHGSAPVSTPEDEAGTVAKKFAATPAPVGRASDVPRGEDRTPADSGGRCPWPFVFFHDPLTGLRDWQTWFVIGLTLCWGWSRINAIVQ